MPTQTPSTELTVYSLVDDKLIAVRDFIQSVAGDEDSNMTKIDTKIGEIADDIEVHKTAINPHGITKEDVDLSNVPNYKVSTKAQAEAGLDDGSLMTPKKTADAIKALSTGGSGGANLFISTKNEYQYISDVATSTIQLPILNFNPEIETIELYLNGARLIKGENFNLVNGVINLAFELGVNKPLNYVTYKTGYHYSDLVGAPDVSENIQTHNTNENSHENIIGMLASLTTGEKANLVAAINEVKSQLNENAIALLDKEDKQTNGVWTPELKGSTVAGTHTFYRKVGTWTKVGKQVTVDFNIYVETWDSLATGNLIIGGLPFIPKSATDSYNSIGAIGNVNLVADDLGLSLNAAGGVANLGILISSKNTLSASSVSIVKPKTVLRGQITYQIK